jgi:hypothetical protein
MDNWLDVPIEAGEKLFHESPHVLALTARSRFCIALFGLRLTSAFSLCISVERQKHR